MASKFCPNVRSVLIAIWYTACLLKGMNPGVNPDPLLRASDKFPCANQKGVSSVSCYVAQVYEPGINWVNYFMMDSGTLNGTTGH